MSDLEDVANAIDDLRAAGINGMTLSEITGATIDELARLRREYRLADQRHRTERDERPRHRAQIEAVRQVLRDHDATDSGDLSSAVGVALSRATRAATQPRTPKRGELVPVACDLGALTNAELRIHFHD